MYYSGRMLTGEIKQILIEVLTEVVSEHQAARAATSMDVVREFMAVRELKF